MDRRERIPNLSELIASAINNRLYTAWTALPGIVQSFNPTEMTVEVQPAIKGYLLQKDGTEKEVNMPLLVDVPVIFPNGGDFMMTFPVRQNDECLVVFSNRCIDKWWQDGGVQGQDERRLYDLSDGFAIVGVKSQPNVLEDVSSENVELRTIDNKCKLYITPDKTIGAFNENYKIKIDNSGNVEIEAKGNVTATVEGETKVKCETIELGTQTMEKMVLGESFQQLFNQHVHLGNLGAPTSPPQLHTVMTAAHLSQENIKNS